MPSSNDSSITSDLDHLVRAACAHFDAAIAVARLGLDEAKRVGDSGAEQFFRHCLDASARVQGEVSSRSEALRRNRPVPQDRGEQVSAATFAPGGGANDAEIIPEEARAKPGNWPAD